jgi:hypothetical protein
MVDSLARPGLLPTLRASSRKRVLNGLLLADSILSAAVSGRVGGQFAGIVGEWASSWLESFQGCRWNGLHRHLALVMLPYSFLVQQRLPPPLEPVGVGPVSCWPLEGHTTSRGSPQHAAATCGGFSVVSLSHEHKMRPSRSTDFT